MAETTNIFDLEPLAFSQTLEELAQDGVEEEQLAFLREQYKQKNSTFSGVYDALRGSDEALASEGKERASVLPMAKPAGMSGLDAIMSGEAEFAMPSAFTEGVRGTIAGFENPGNIAKGVPYSKQELETAATQTSALMPPVMAATSAPAQRLAREFVDNESGAVPVPRFLSGADEEVVPLQRNSVTRGWRFNMDAAATDAAKRTEYNRFGYSAPVDNKDIVDSVGPLDLNSIEILNIPNREWARLSDRVTRETQQLLEQYNNAEPEFIQNYRKDVVDNYLRDKGFSAGYADVGITILDKIEADETFMKFMMYRDINPHIPFDSDFKFNTPIYDEPIATYDSPVKYVADNLVYPKDGIKGSAFLKELQDSPGVRRGEVDSMGMEIDPQKRYTREELTSIVDRYKYNVRLEVVPNKPYINTQRQPLKSEDIEYNVLAIRADRDPSLPKYEGKGNHFTEDTIAHTRVAENVIEGKPAVVVNEIQSDLLQAGYLEKKSAVTFDEFYKLTAPSVDTVLKTYKITDPNTVSVIKEFSDSFIKEQYEITLAQRANKSVFDVKEKFKDLRKEQGIPLTTEQLATSLEKQGVDGHPFTNDLLYELQDATYDLDFHSRTSPPIIEKEAKEAVRMTIDGILAYAQRTGNDTVYIPSLESIVAERFTPNSTEYYKAVTPGSGFHNTYMRHLDQVTGELQTTQGNKLSIGKVDLTNEYKASPVVFVIPDETLVDIRKDVAKLKAYVEVASGNISDEKFTQRSGFNNTIELKKYFEEKYQIGGKPAIQFNRGDTLKDLEESLYNVAKYTNFDNVRPISREATKIQINSGNFTKLHFAEGGVVTDNMETEMKQLLAEGGLKTDGAPVDPVSGNEVPIGSNAEEVRDDIDAKLSEGEYVVPADVVRYYGVAFFEKLRNRAKAGLDEMHQDGRIGGDPVPAEGGEMEDDDALPFDVSELQVVGDDMDEQMAEAGFAEGGDVAKFDPSKYGVGFSVFGETKPPFGVTNPNQTGGNTTPQYTSKTYVNAKGEQIIIQFDAQGKPITPIPAGYWELGTTPPATEKPTSDGGGGGGGSSTTSTGQNTNATGGFGLKDFDLSDPAKQVELGKADLEAATKMGNIGALAGIVAGPIAGIGGKLAAAGIQVAQSRAREQVLRAYGYTAEADALKAENDKFVSSLPSLARMYMNSFATGNGYARATIKGLTEQGFIPGQTTPTKRASNVGGSSDYNLAPVGTKKGNTLVISKSADGGGNSGYTPKPVGTKQGDSLVISKSADGGAKPSSSSSSGTGSATKEKSDAIASGSTAASGKSYSSVGGYTSGRAKGGLVSRKKTKK